MVHSPGGDCYCQGATHNLYIVKFQGGKTNHEGTSNEILDLLEVGSKILLPTITPPSLITTVDG